MREVAPRPRPEGARVHDHPTLSPPLPNFPSPSEPSQLPPLFSKWHMRKGRRVLVLQDSTELGGEEKRYALDMDYLQYF